MSVKGWLSRFLSSPRGMWTTAARKRTGNPERAVGAQNVRLSPGTYATRPGTTAVFSSTGTVSSMFNWVTPAGVSLVLYKDGDAVKCYNQSTLAITTLLSGLNGAVQVVFAAFNVWVYFCGYDANDNGTFQTRIFDGTNVDIAFRGAVTLTGSTTSNGGAGYATAGIHYFGFVYQNRTGYSGVPVTATTYAITATANVSFSVTATTNANPDVLTVPGHTFSNGQYVTGSGATGDTAINGVFQVANVSGSTLQLIYPGGGAVAGNGAYAGGGSLTAPDLITAPGNNLVTGNTLSIAGALGDTGINGNWTATVVTPGSTFYAFNSLTGSPVNYTATYTGSGILTVPIQITILPGYSITATSSIGFSVTGATNANPTVVSLPGHNFVNGQVVTGAGATGNTAINGVFTVTGAVAGTSIKLLDSFGNPVAGNGAWVSGGTMTAPDLITAPGNNLNSGDYVTIAGATGDTAINGSWTATVVAPGNTFTLTDGNGNPVNSNGGYTGGGTVQGPTPNTEQVNISVNLPAQLDGGTDANGGVQATLFLIATPASNPNNWFFIPTNAQTGQIGEQPVPYDTAATLNFVFNTSDFDINASYDSANANFLFMSQDSSGNGPFMPNFVSVYGTRMVYGTGTIAYASELDNPQQISADLNQIIMPNQRQIAMAFQLPNSSSLYLTGDRWTAYVTDNGDTPSTWPVPVGVSAALGAPFAHCVCFSTGSNNAWIATQPGIYYFDGTYHDKPLTYLISDLWTGVNWSVAYVIEMADNISELRLFVTIPYNPSLPTVPSQVLLFDYQNGKEFDQCDISYDIFTQVPATAALGSIATIKETNGRTNVWIGPQSGGNVVRYDSTVYTDQGAAMSSFWISGLFVGVSEMTAQMLRIGQADIWLRGSGVCAGPVWYGPDNVITVSSTLQSTAGVNVNMSPNPGIMYQTRLDFHQIENFNVGIGAGVALGDWFSLSGIRPYYRPDLYNR